MTFGRGEEDDNSGGWQNPRQVMQAELNAGEELLWADAPSSVIRHGAASLPRMFFGIPFFSFAVFWTWTATTPLRKGSNLGIDGFQFIFPMFGIPFLIVGLGMLLSPLWKIFKAKHTTYALTDKRLIIREGFPSVQVKSWSLADVKNLSRNGPAEGPGDLYFAETSKSNPRGKHRFKKVGFIGISEPKRLEDTIRKTVKW